MRPEEKLGLKIMTIIQPFKYFNIIFNLRVVVAKKVVMATHCLNACYK